MEYITLQELNNYKILSAMKKSRISSQKNIVKGGKEVYTKAKPKKVKGVKRK